MASLALRTAAAAVIATAAVGAAAPRLPPALLTANVTLVGYARARVAANDPTLAAAAASLNASAASVIADLAT
jgi:hypothetical protein